MKPAVPIAFSPAVQMIIALDSVVDRPVVDRSEPVTAPVNWAGRVIAAATPFERSDLEHLFYPTSTTVFLFHAVIRKELHDVEALVAEFGSMETTVFERDLREFFQVKPDEGEWVTVDRLTRALEEDRDRERVSFHAEAEHLVHLLSNPDAFRLKLVEVMQWFNERVFAHYVDDQRGRVERWIADNATATEANREAALNQLTRGNYDSLLAERDAVRLFPVVDSHEDQTWLMVPGGPPGSNDAYFVFDTGHANRVLMSSHRDEAFQAVTDEALEALADGKRIAILRLLRQRAHFSKEIADAIGVSASTASYHIDKLVAARFIHLEISRGRRFYYSINGRGVRDFLERFESEFVATE